MPNLKYVLLIAGLIGVFALVGIIIGRESSSITSAFVAENIACYEDSDCDDHISETKDVCKNPGTWEALCVNRPEK